MLSKENIKRIEDMCSNGNINILQDITLDDINTRSTLNLHCNNCQDIFTMTIANMLDVRRQGGLCQKCNKINIYKNTLIEKYGSVPYTFITPLTTDRTAEITVRCNTCGDEFVTTMNRTLMNSKQPEGIHPCKRCTFLRRYKKDESYFIDELTKKFGTCNYTLVDKDKFTGFASKEKITMRCNICGHEFHTYPMNVYNPTNGRHYCRVCNHKDRLLENMSYRERCLSVTEGWIEPIEEYIDSRTPIRHKCNICGHGVNNEWLKIPVKNTLRNAGCPICTNRTIQSAAELEVLDFIRSIYSGVILEKDRSVLSNNREIDIYLPEIKLGIEYCGLFYHSTRFKDKLYHQNKTRELLDQGIALITIFEDKWVLEKDRIRDLLESIINNNYNLPDIGTSIELDLTESAHIVKDLLETGDFRIEVFHEPSISKFSRSSNNYIIVPADGRDDLEIYDCGKITLTSVQDSNS